MIDGHPKAVVEAKTLRHAISDQDAAQCVQYASMLGAPWCRITNGVGWHLYCAHATGPLATKLVAQVRLDQDEAALAEAWRVLSLVAKESLSQTNPLTKLLVERVVIDELSRPDSPAIAALRRAVRDRFRESVSSQSVLEALARWRPPSPALPPGRTHPTSSPPTSVPRSTVKRSAPIPGSLLRLVDAGLLPADASLGCRLYRVTHVARLREGHIEPEGHLYDSPSAAGSALREGKATNG